MAAAKVQNQCGGLPASLVMRRDGRLNALAAAIGGALSKLCLKLRRFLLALGLLRIRLRENDRVRFCCRSFNVRGRCVCRHTQTHGNDRYDAKPCCVCFHDILLSMFRTVPCRHGNSKCC
jgi:hypothetical protein